MITTEAAPTLTPRSADICGNRESETRTIDWLANEANASSVMALVALVRLAGEGGGKVDSGGPGRLSTARLYGSSVHPHGQRGHVRIRRDAAGFLPVREWAECGSMQTRHPLACDVIQQNDDDR